jgi:trigger factor
LTGIIERKQSLKIEREYSDDHQIKITVELEPETLENAKRRVARKLSKRVKIPGFRPGKAPYPMVARHVGEDAILDDAIEELINDIYPKAIEEAEVEPYGPGSLENVLTLDPPTFEFLVPLMPEVELGDYHSLQLPYELEEVTEEEIEEVLRDLQDRQAVMAPVERPAQENDMVYIRLSAERVDPDEAQDATLLEERKLPVVVEAEYSSPEEMEESGEWPFPGFSRELIGLSAGDEKKIKHTFSEEVDFESLQGEEAEFHILVEEIKERDLPELNDEFAQSVSDLDTLEELRETIADNLKEQRQSEYQQDYDNRILEELVEQSVIKYPPQMLEREMENVINDLTNRLEQQSMDMDLYLKTRDIEKEDLEEEARPVAEKRMKKSLVLYEISREEGIEIEPDELQEETSRTLEELSRYLPEKEMQKFTDKETSSSLVNNIVMDMISNKTIQRLRAIARGEEPETEIGAGDENEAVEPEKTEGYLEETISQGSSAAETAPESSEQVAQEASEEKKETEGE